MRLSLHFGVLFSSASALALLSHAAVLPGQDQAGAIRFVENRGQWPAAVSHRVEQGPVSTWLVDDGWVMQVEFDDGEVGRRGVAVRMAFVDSESRASALRVDRAAGLRNYFLGDDPRGWATGVRSFGRVEYPSLYPGVDLIVRDGGDAVEYDLAFAPYADPGSVVVQLTGHDRLWIDDDGSLVVGTLLGEIRQKPPLTWTEGRLGRQVVPCRFVVLAPDRYGFEVGGWSGAEALVIDPGLVWSSHIGGGNNESVQAVHAVSNGEVVAAGETLSGNFPTTLGAYQTANVHQDLFVTRFAADGASVLFSTYLGGTAREWLGGLDVTPTGAVVLGGKTESTNYPVTGDAYQSTRSGPNDACIARLNATGSVLEYATYFGSNGHDDVVGIHVEDITNRIYVGGMTGGSGIPITAGQRPFAGIGDAYIAILDTQTQPGTTMLAYGTHYGGNSNMTESTNAMHVDGNGVVTLAGVTPALDLPVTPTAAMSTRTNSWMGWIARVDPSQSGSATLVYGSYLGGAGTAAVYIGGVHSTDQGVITVAGHTSMTWPVTTTALQQVPAGGYDGFVTVVDTAQSGTNAITYSTLYGDQGYEVLHAMHRSPDGIIAIGGRDNVWGIPTTSGALQTRKVWGRSDGFVALIDPGQSGAASLVYGSYFGLCHGPAVLAIERDGNGILTVGGEAHVDELPTTQGAFQPTFGGGGMDGFVARIDPAPLPPSSTSHGTACPGSVGVPQLGLPQQVSLCRPFNIQATGLPLNQFGLIHMGFQNTFAGAVPLPFSLASLGAPGCSAYAPNDFIFFQPTGNGTSTMVFNVPGWPSLVGIHLYYQYLFVDLPANPLGIVATNGVETVLGF